VVTQQLQMSSHTRCLLRGAGFHSAPHMKGFTMQSQYFRKLDDRNRTRFRFHPLLRLCKTDCNSYRLT
jgi:hypothetical protein